MTDTQKIVTRFAPSPTGKAHAGGYRTAMYAWLFARQHGGKFILRIEDTDTARNTKEAEQDIYEALQWIGITHDELYIQSKNLDRHREVMRELIDAGKAYISREEAKDGSGVMKDLVRFRNPGKSITFTDLIRGVITIDTTDLGDFIIARSIDEPVYHLAVVVDDHDEGVTHVIRAEEHISNTPRHILIHEALGWGIPQYAHLPLVLSADRQKLSKRKGALAMTDYRNLGYLPEAVFNYVAMLGWNPADPGSDQELFSVEDLIKRFDFSRMQKSGAIFSLEKLDWFNREYIKRLSDESFIEYAMSFIPSWADIHMVKKAKNLLRERISKFADVTTFFEENIYLFKDPQIDPQMLLWKELRDTPDGLTKTKEYLQTIISTLETLDDSRWNQQGIKDAVWSFAEEVGRGAVLWPFRVALSGREKSPDPFELATILGKETTLRRLQNISSLK